MSILAAGGASKEVIGTIYMVVGPIVAVLAAIALKLWRGRLVVGPERMDAREPVGPLAVVMAIGFAAWVLTAAVYVMVAHPRGRGSDDRPTTQSVELTQKETVLVGTAGPVVAFIALLAATGILRRGGVGRMGFRLSRLPRGAALGLLGICFVMPVMSWLSVFMVWLYRRVGFEHPMKHDLLQILGQRGEPPWLKYLIVVTAVVVAPVFEELFFRGHVQTLARRIFAPPTRADETGGGGMLQYAGPGAPSARTDPTVRVWAAVVVTSIAFAIVHAPWTWPMIFVLSLCLGYAYERTGNLWVPIVMHALFNGISTAISVYST
jgi:membrane protease YdiL (CAAX protease family)